MCGGYGEWRLTSWDARNYVDAEEQLKWRNDMGAIQSLGRLGSNVGTEALVQTWPILSRITPLRSATIHAGKAFVHLAQKRPHVEKNYPLGVVEDRSCMGRAILHTVERLLTSNPSPEVRRAAIRILTQGVIPEGVDRRAAERFHSLHDTYPPGFLLISPGSACNLRCVGCYADSGPKSDKLDWATFDRIITEARDLWGVRFIVISGGEYG
jgi:hypothetical protein